jgi:hypothetical protein
VKSRSSIFTPRPRNSGTAAPERAENHVGNGPIDRRKDHVKGRAAMFPGPSFVVLLAKMEKHDRGARTTLGVAVRRSVYFLVI